MNEVIISSSSYLEECIVNIYDIDGRVVFTAKQSGGAALRIDTLNWKGGGMYVVTMGSGEGNAREMLTVVRCIVVYK